MRKNPKGRCKKICNSQGYFPRRKCDILLTQGDIGQEGKLWYPFTMLRSKWASAFFCGSPFFYNIFEEIYHRKSLYCPLSGVDRSFSGQSYITVGCTDPYAQPADG